jgi:hypothetical protein
VSNGEREMQDRGVGEGRRAGERLRYTVEDAAAVLGMTTGAVRNRLSQGTLRSVEEHGTLYVLLPADIAPEAVARDTGDIPGEFLLPADISSRDTAQDTARVTGDIPGESRALMSEMRDRIAFLEQQREESSALMSEMRDRIAFLERGLEESSAPVSEMRERIASLERELEGSSALVSEMREQIAFLERERERKDTILLGIAEAVRDISSPTEQPGRVGPITTPLEGAQEEPAQERRPWWRRMFGG